MSLRDLSSYLQALYERLEKHFGKQDWWPAESDLEIIIGAILTQNTSWRNVEKAIANLKQGGLLTPSGLKMVDDKTLQKLLYPAGFYRMKARYIKAFITFLFGDYGGDLGKLLQENTESLRRKLLAVEGIGEETADSILLYAGKRPVFVVDNYTKRILNRHGVINGQERYGEIQARLMKHLPKDVDLFSQFHALIVQLGKCYCRRVANCAPCPLKDLPSTM